MSGPADAGEWPQGAADEIDQWRQGHVLDGVPLVVVGAPSETTPIWAVASRIDPGVAGAPLLMERDSVPRRAMIVSQGCEVVKLTFPAVTVVPVYEATNVLTESQQQSARAGQTWHLVHLTAEWARTGFWVADLRLELPVDKTLLLGKTPMDAFSDEVGYSKLAERLATSRQRAAVPQPTIDHIVTPLREHLASVRAAGGSPLDGVREVRIASNHYTAPTSVTLFVIADLGASVDASIWMTAVDAVQPRASANGIALVGPEITTMWEMTAADYLTSGPIADADSS